MKQQQTKIKTFQIRYRFIIESNNYYYKQCLISQYNDKIHPLRRNKDYIHNVIHYCNTTINFNQKRNEFIYSNYPHDYEHFLKKSIKKKKKLQLNYLKNV